LRQVTRIRVKVSPGTRTKGWSPYGAQRAQRLAISRERGGRCESCTNKPTVTGNRASVGGIIEQSNEAQHPVGRAVQLAFTDNGDRGVAKDTQVTYPGIDSASPCRVPLFDSQPELALIDGNYAVHDAQP